MERPKIRLYVEAELAADGEIALSDSQAHYLFDVMRHKAGTEVALFNGRDGEWRATVDEVRRKGGRLRLAGQCAPQTGDADLWLLFAPIKRARIDFLAEKATELGVSRLVPVITQRTQVARVNAHRLRANAIEAAEQTERLSVPEVAEPRPLQEVLMHWQEKRILLAMDETGGGRPLAEVVASLAAEDGAGPPPCAILIGPEGGFAEAEIEALRAHPSVRTAGLGPRILRSDTAALAALACWQALAGDWSASPRGKN